MNDKNLEIYINKYLDDELSDLDQTEFENFLDKNHQIKSEVQCMKKIKDMNYLTASDNFMTGLNKKIYIL